LLFNFFNFPLRRPGKVSYFNSLFGSAEWGLRVPRTVLTSRLMLTGTLLGHAALPEKGPTCGASGPRAAAGPGAGLGSPTALCWGRGTPDFVLFQVCGGGCACCDPPARCSRLLSPRCVETQRLPSTASPGTRPEVGREGSRIKNKCK